ncbi:type IV secretion system protein [Neisseria sicca]|uniref:type IV secretion system protein n=1 Tax=Neisseria sicca TaxID=490 RepID=UPI000D30C015|nr:type IV secretion system protein [Neisseria sicca]
MKIHFKKTVCSVLLAVSLASVPLVSTAGIPVIDGAAAAQREKNFAKEMLEMGKQLTEMKRQFEQQVKQFKAMTGSRNMGNLLKDTVKDQIPSEWSEIYKGAKNIDYKSVINSKAYNPETAQRMAVHNMKEMEKVFNSMETQLKSLSRLMDEVNNTQDIKAATDLQNRISVEQAKIANNQTKLDMLDRLYKRQQEIEQRQYASREECMARHIRDRNYAVCNQ